VIELAKRLVARPEFLYSADETEQRDYLYERIYQRPPNPEETALGLEFVNQTPLRDDALAAGANGVTMGKPGPANKAGANGKKRAPLTSWEEYAQALLQANETSFVN